MSAPRPVTRPGPSWLEGLAEAVRFLTVAPIPGPRGDAGAHAHPASGAKPAIGAEPLSGPETAPSAVPALGAASAWFPLVGLGIGLVVALAISFPLPALPRAALGLAVWTALTGALHEDGWIDCMDALFAPVGRERRLEILKDPRVGAHGLVGGVLLLLARFAALALVPGVAVVAAAVVGRWVMALSLAVAPAASSRGLGAAYRSDARPLAATLLAALPLGGLLVWTGDLRVITAGAFGLLAALALGAFIVRRLGGLTGDGHGAVGIFAETLALWAFSGG